MASLLRSAPRALRQSTITSSRVLPAIQHNSRQRHDLHDPPTGNFPTPGRGPPEAPKEENAHLRDNYRPGSFLGTTKRLPEYNLHDKVVLVTGAARGLGLVQAEALLEAGATVYALDRLPEPSPDFYRVQQRAAEELGKSDLARLRKYVHDVAVAISQESLLLFSYCCDFSLTRIPSLGNTLHYRQIDVRDVPQLNEIVRNISETHGHLDGLVAAAGIQQETSALDYSAQDANTMFEVNVTGVFMTAQAVAREMIRWGNGGSIAMIASMSGTVANRVSWLPASHRRLSLRASCVLPAYILNANDDPLTGPHLPRIQCLQSRCSPARP